MPTGTRRLARIATVLVVTALVTAGALWWVFGDRGDKTVTAYFDRAVGVYPGSDVKVLGVRVGEVVSVTPEPSRVRLTMTVAEEAPVAHDTRALVVSPSVVADRYVQLSDLAHGGPRLADGAVIPRSRTAVPVELDELYESLGDLATALGPDGANANGALSDLLDTGADVLDGNGEAFSRTVRNFADLARTLADSDDDLFATIDSLSRFTAMLAGNDAQVREATGRLADVADLLAEDKEELSAALAALGDALADLQEFVADHREALKSNVDDLADLTQLVVERRASLAEALDVAPTAAENAYNTFDPDSGTLQGRINPLEYIPSQEGGPR
ncbi:MCE family protein [Saccharomonospora xinjiangensis]|uniref:Virulence factor Mce family protein n=1 Tax=Saccharomonospora xinjiangensis XJ-54 TaxID=882086 RepID=I0UZK3_9PSEU|nr:MCE family protein [Saccharomonospora xinjiangensis]EID53306.1 virulence factor Mce family protein [Saccharomonospora xinjiangensis XJ-54]